MKTSNEGEDDDDGDEYNKSHCHYCINLSDYIDINQTKYYDAVVILSSFVNFVFSIILLIDFYNNKQWTYFVVSLSFHIFSHLCYTVRVCCSYHFNLKIRSSESIWMDRMIVILYFIVLLLFSPFINLFTYLTSEDHLILTNVLKPTIEMDRDIRKNSSSWIDNQLKRLYGYLVIETIFSNLPQCCIELVLISHCIYDFNSNYNYSSVKFYLFLAFYVNLFSIVIKSCFFPFGCLFDDMHMYDEKSLKLKIAAMADFSTTIYLIIWMYVCFFCFLFVNFLFTLYIPHTTHICCIL